MSGIFGAGPINTISQSYAQAISEGKVDSLVPWSKVGYSPASTAAETVVWGAGTDYVFPTAEMGMEVVSSDNVDDKAGGAGALSVKISYLTSTFEEKNEILALNGTTVVPTVATDIYRINSFCVYAWGANKKPTGNITIRHLDNTPVYEYISAGRNASRSFVYTVPKNKVLFISNIFFSASANATGKRVLFTTMGTYDSFNKVVTPEAYFPYTDFSLLDTAISVDFQMPTKFPEGVDIKIIILGEAGSVCTCGARGWLKPI